MPYRTKFRPAHFSALPDGVTIEYIEAPPDMAHMRPDLPVSQWRFGVFVASRPLTKYELERFELAEVLPIALRSGDDKP